MKLTSKEQHRFEALREELANAREELRAAILAYNEKLRETDTFAAEVATRVRDAWDGRSEKWQDSDRGQTAATWVESWEGYASEELEEPEEGDFEELEAMDEAEEG